jgi:hypothetical protein
MHVIDTQEGQGLFRFYCIFGLTPRPVAAQATPELLSGRTEGTGVIGANIEVVSPNVNDPTACQVTVIVVDAQALPRPGAFYVLIF